MFAIKKLFFNLSKFIYFPTCWCCKAKISEYNTLCYECNNSLQRVEAGLCNICGVSSENNPTTSLAELTQPNKLYICNNCKQVPPYFNGITTSLVYNQYISRLISDFKYQDNTGMVTFLGNMLCKSYIKASFYQQIDIIMPLPISYLKLISRKYNQTAMLAKYLSNKTKVKLATNVLRKIKHNQAQASLNLEDRLNNIKGVFQVNLYKQKLVKNKNVLLVEDIVTTGNTVNEAAKMLKLAGAKKVFIIAIARVAGELKIYYNNI